RRPLRDSRRARRGDRHRRRGDRERARPGRGCGAGQCRHRSQPRAQIDQRARKLPHRQGAERQGAGGGRRGGPADDPLRNRDAGGRTGLDHPVHPRWRGEDPLRPDHSAHR
ncbi:hypothetical protein LTR94_034790, partial [Friedmanniomyces endolithicus]